MVVFNISLCCHFAVSFCVLTFGYAFTVWPSFEWSALKKHMKSTAIRMRI